MTSYAVPVHHLLTLGRPAFAGPWEDYSRLGIASADVPELIRLMTDMQLNLAQSKSQEVWGPVHAWRALAQLRATEAVGPYLDLLDALDKEDADDWMKEEMPAFFTTIGPSTVPALITFLGDEKHSLYPRWRAADALVEMAQEHPETRPEVMAALVRQMERAAENDAELNGGLVACFLDLNAVEAAPVIERAFAAGVVDETIAGDWEQVQYDMGLRSEPPQPKMDFRTPPLPYRHLPLAIPSGHTPSARAKERAKARRKAAKQTRKKNRKKKR